MDDLFKSANRLWLATSLRGVQQLGSLFDARSSRYPSNGAQVGAFSKPDLDVSLIEGTARAIYGSGRQIQRQAFTTISDLFSQEVPTPRLAMRTAFQIMQDSAEIMELLTPYRDGQIAWAELHNKLQSFYLFEYIDLVLDISPEVEPSLQELLNRASRLGSFFSVWATEGIGHYYSDWHLARGSLPELLLPGQDRRDLPPSSLIPLYAGLGLSLAESFLRIVDIEQIDTGIAVDRFIQHCQNNVRKGFAGEVCEALGLATRNLYPHLVNTIDLHLSQIDDALLAYFWHGVGRAIYFVPTNFPPFRNAPWKAVEMCLREPAHSLGKCNALAGFAWALTLVNLRKPEVMATFLKHHWKDVANSDAFANGVCSAVLVWHDCAPGDEDLDEFRRYAPPKSDTSLVDLWTRFVTQACNDALRYHPIIAKRGVIGEIFRYHDLSEFVRTLERTQDDFTQLVAHA